MWKLDNSWEQIEKLIIYGFGRVAKANIDILLNDFSIIKIIDNNDAYKGSIYKGIPIISLREYKGQEIGGEKIVVAATGRALESITNELECGGWKQGVDYTDISTFLGEWYLRFKGKLSIGRVAHSITQKCTFRCKDCQILIPYIKEQKHFDLAILKKDIDLFFGVVDFVSDFDIMGGETFLYPNLLQYLEYLLSNYKDKIGNIQLVTNASIVPGKDVLTYISDKGIKVRISDYSNEIPYKEKIEKFVNELEFYNISYDRFEEMQWTMFGYPYGERIVEDNKEIMQKHMKKCNGGMSKSLQNGKLYYCNTAGGACGNMGYKLDKSDYIDLAELSHTSIDDKNKIWRYCMGEMENGAMKICGYCRGYADERIIPAGVQLK